MKIALVCVLACCVAAAYSVTLSKVPADAKWVDLSTLNIHDLGDIWKDCGKLVIMSPSVVLIAAAGTASDGVKIVSVTISPDPPEKGKNVNITATVTFGKILTNCCILLHTMLACRGDSD